MRHEFTVIVGQNEGWFVARCPQVSEANGQGRTKQEALRSLAAAIELAFEDRACPVKVSVEKDGLLVHRLRRRVTLDELLVRVTKSNIHGDVSSGASMGREDW